MPFNIIIGTKGIRKIKMILNFAEGLITWDDIELSMKPDSHFDSPENLCTAFIEATEPKEVQQASNRVNKILDAKYEKADLPKIIKENCEHLNVNEKNSLLHTLLNFEGLFDGSLGEWQTKPVSVEIKPNVTPYHAKPFGIPQIHMDTVKKEVERLVELGVLEKDHESAWASPCFIIPKKTGTVRFITDLRQVNKRIVRKPFPLPKITDVMQRLQGFQYASALDLNMGYYHIRLDPDA